MKIIRNKSDGVVIYQFDENVEVSLSSILKAGNLKVHDVNSDDHELVTGVIECPEFTGGSVKYDGKWRKPNNNIIRKKKISRYDFLELFTDAEYAAITDAAATDKKIARLLDRIRLREGPVDLAETKITQGMAYIEGQGLITAERKAEILRGIES